MSNAEILVKALEKACKNGWQPFKERTRNDLLKDGHFIFEHKFAKAFWGEGTGVICSLCRKDKKSRYDDCECGGCLEYDYMQRWEVELQQMVLEENPIKYLEKFL